jgi:hypothetical protein
MAINLTTRKITWASMWGSNFGHFPDYESSFSFLEGKKGSLSSFSVPSFYNGKRAIGSPRPLERQEERE